jgi:glycosyltransferase involved in cell wall biosynthesis
MSISLPSVSIVMTPKDRRRQLDTTLETIFAQQYPDLEIIIVEDRPTEASLEAYCTRNKIKYAARRSRLEGWLNPAPLMNRGLLLATKEIVIFQNAEVKHERLDNIVNLVSPIAKAKLDQESPLSTCALVQSLNKDGSFEMWYTHNREGHRVGWISPFCQAIPRQSLLKIQGVEESFTKYGMEDDMLEFMLRYSGVQLRYVENTLCSHQWHERFSGDQNNGGPDIYKRIRTEIEIGARPCVANWNKSWGNL